MTVEAVFLLREELAMYEIPPAPDSAERQMFSKGAERKAIHRTLAGEAENVSSPPLNWPPNLKSRQPYFWIQKERARHRASRPFEEHQKVNLPPSSSVRGSHALVI